MTDARDALAQEAYPAYDSDLDKRIAFRSGWDAAVAYLTSDEAVERLAEALHPGLFSLTDSHWAQRWDNPEHLRKPMQDSEVRIIRAAILAAIGENE